MTDNLELKSISTQTLGKGEKEEGSKVKQTMKFQQIHVNKQLGGGATVARNKSKPTTAKRLPVIAEENVYSRPTSIADFDSSMALSSKSIDQLRKKPVSSKSPVSKPNKTPSLPAPHKHHRTASS